VKTDRKYDVVGLGVCTLDLLQVVDKLPGGEMVQRASESTLQGGGPVATAMVALARLGSRTAMIDKLGDDWRGRLIIDELRKEKVATEWIRVIPGRDSSIATILVRRRDGARAISFSPGNAGDLAAEELAEDTIAQAAILHLNGRHLGASLRAVQLARAHGVTVSFDGGADRYFDGVRDIIAMTDICIVARRFAAAFSGETDPATAGRSLLKAGPGIVVITAGAEGSLVMTKEGRSFHQPAFQVVAVDTTGAGDAYHGAFLFGIVKGLDLKECASLAAAVAAMNTGKLGGRSALPTLEEIHQFRRTHEANA
jgi:sulfofructose kinase